MGLEVGIADLSSLDAATIATMMYAMLKSTARYLRSKDEFVSLIAKRRCVQVGTLSLCVLDVSVDPMPDRFWWSSLAEDGIKATR